MFHCVSEDKQSGLIPSGWEVCGCTVCLVGYKLGLAVFSVDHRRPSLSKKIGLPDNEQIASSHMWLSPSAVMELEPISIIHHYIIFPLLYSKITLFYSVCSTLDFAD